MLNEYKDILDNIEENAQYEEYLETHISNVQKAYEWLKENIPHVLTEDNYIDETAYYGPLDDIIAQHDKSKYTRIPDAENYYELSCEYDAYADYFYREQTQEVKDAFSRAWLTHIHKNPHHWQHWILHNDTEGTKVLDMPYVFVVEMFCDHFSFSITKGDLSEIFNWYDSNKDHMILSDKTRKTYEYILEEARNIIKGKE